MYRQKKRWIAILLLHYSSFFPTELKACTDNSKNFITIAITVWHSISHIFHTLIKKQNYLFPHRFFAYFITMQLFVQYIWKMKVDFFNFWYQKLKHQWFTISEKIFLTDIFICLVYSKKHCKNILSNIHWIHQHIYKLVSKVLK